MKKILLSVLAAISANLAFAQITITAADMPVLGDTLRYSSALGLTSGINVYDSGTNKAWVYDTLKAVAQARNDYKSALMVSPLYGIISLTAYGYKVADSIPGIGAAVPGLTITNIYTFFNKKSGPSRFIAEGFGATVSSVPIPSVYSDEDEIYYFPLTYPHAQDSSTFAVTLSIPVGPLSASLKIAGYRKTRVDGWGTIKTPYHTTPVNCIRVRSEIHEIDSVKAPPPLSLNLAIPMDSIEYKWLVNGEHYPALWVVQSRSTGALTSVTYRDSLRHGLLNVNNTRAITLQEIKIYPNPVVDGYSKIEVPAGWNNFTVYVYDITGRIVATLPNKNELDVRSLTSGKYNLLVKSGDKIGYAQIIKQ